MANILKGKYANGIFSNRLDVVQGTKIIKVNIESMEVISSDSRKSLGSAIGRGAVGGLLGPVGMLGGALSAKNKKTHLVQFNYKEGGSSIVELKDKTYKKLQLKLM